MALPTFTPGTTIKANEMNQALATLFDMVYPVGSIYMSATLSTAAQVEAALGGTWVAWGAGRVPVGVDTDDTSFDTAEETGGEKYHQLTTNEMPKHHHEFTFFTTGTAHYRNGMQQVGLSNTVSGYGAAGMADAGGNAAHNNLQPYITCYMYKRTA
jgi:hypothetical protein